MPLKCELYLQKEEVARVSVGTVGARPYCVLYFGNNLVFPAGTAAEQRVFLEQLQHAIVEGMYELRKLMDAAAQNTPVAVEAEQVGS